MARMKNTPGKSIPMQKVTIINRKPVTPSTPTGMSQAGSGSISGGVQQSAQTTGSPAHWESGRFVQATGNYPTENPANVRRESIGGQISSAPSAPAFGATKTDSRTAVPGVTLIGKSSWGSNIYQFGAGGNLYRSTALRPEDVKSGYFYNQPAQSLASKITSKSITPQAGTLSSGAGYSSLAGTVFDKKDPFGFRTRTPEKRTSTPAEGGLTRNTYYQTFDEAMPFGSINRAKEEKKYSSGAVWGASNIQKGDYVSTFLAQEKKEAGSVLKSPLKRSEIYLEEQGDKYSTSNYKTVLQSALIGYGKGVIGTVSMVAHPVKTYGEVKTIVKDPYAFFYGMREYAETKPFEFGGMLLGSEVTARGLGFGVKKTFPRISIADVKIPTAKGNINAKIFGIETPKGLEPFGIKRSTPLITKVSTESVVRGGESFRVQRTAAGKFRDFGASVPTAEILWGKKKLTSRVGISEVSEAQGLAQPVSATGYQAFNRLLKETPKQEARTMDIFPKIGINVYGEKGQSVKSFVADIKGIHDKAKVTAMVEDFMAENKGTYFGSLGTKQLPAEGEFTLGGYKIGTGFRTKHPGDIDVQFTDLTVEEIAPKLKSFGERLRSSGEDIGVSADNILEFTTGKYKGEKFLEAKSGINQASLGLGDEAPAGIAGFSFANLKGGQSPKTVPFGKGRAIYAGEQTLRKGAGALIVSPGKLPGETAAFSVADIIGKQGNPRGLKDIAGFLQQTKGIAQLKHDRWWNPLEVRRGKKLDILAEKFFQTYTPAQQKDIIVKLKDIIGSGEAEKIPLYSSSAAKTTISPSRARPSILSAVVGKSTSRGVSPAIQKELSYGVSPSTRKYSGYSSPTMKRTVSSYSPSQISRNISRAVSGRSSGSYGTKSPSNYSPKVKSPSYSSPSRVTSNIIKPLYSPSSWSGYPSKYSRGSPAGSVYKSLWGSSRSPSPYSVTRKTSKKIYPVPFPEMKLEEYNSKRKNKVKRGTEYVPSVVGVEYKVVMKSIKNLTGIEIRGLRHGSNSKLLREMLKI